MSLLAIWFSEGIVSIKCFRCFSEKPLFGNSHYTISCRNWQRFFLHDREFVRDNNEIQPYRQTRGGNCADG